MIKKIIKWVCILCFGFVCVIFGRGYLFYTKLIENESIEEKVSEIENSNTFVPYEYLPKTLVNATVSIEDHRFFEHKGIDYIGLARAFTSWFVPGMVESGGSTITQQVAKNMYTMFDSSLDRKAVEFFVANALEQKYSKEEIFSIYVNIINYGDNHMGISEAASGYFQKSVWELNENECTLLAGIPQSPANYQLSTHYEEAKQRQLLVLQSMVENKYLMDEEVNQILQKD